MSEPYITCVATQGHSSREVGATHACQCVSPSRVCHNGMDFTYPIPGCNPNPNPNPNPKELRFGRQGGGGSQKLREDNGWYLWVYVHLLSRESSTRGWEVGCPRVGLGLEGAGSKKKKRELGSPLSLPKSAVGNYFYQGRSGQLSRYLQKLLLPLSVPPMRAPHRAHPTPGHATPAPVPVPQRACTGTAARLYRYRSALVPVPQRTCTGTAARLYRYCSALVTVLQRVCTGNAARLYRYCSAPVPVLQRGCTGTAARLYQYRSAVVPVPQYRHTNITPTHENTNTQYLQRLNKSVTPNVSFVAFESQPPSAAPLSSSVQQREVKSVL